MCKLVVRDVTHGKGAQPCSIIVTIAKPPGPALQHTTGSTDSSATLPELEISRRLDALHATVTPSPHTRNLIREPMASVMAWSIVASSESESFSLPRTDLSDRHVGGNPLHGEAVRQEPVTLDLGGVSPYRRQSSEAARCSKHTQARVRGKGGNRCCQILGLPCVWRGQGLQGMLVHTTAVRALPKMLSRGWDSSQAKPSVFCKTIAEHQSLWWIVPGR